MPDGRRVSYSLVNNTSPRFDVPPQYTAAAVLPGLAAAERGADYDASVCHFLSLCMKLVYEKEEVIQVCRLRPLPLSLASSAPHLPVRALQH